MAVEVERSYQGFLVYIWKIWMKNIYLYAGDEYFTSRQSHLVITVPRLMQALPT
jgi:hypothetical protein